jgi:hypothetical protein
MQLYPYVFLSLCFINPAFQKRLKISAWESFINSRSIKIRASLYVRPGCTTLIQPESSSGAMSTLATIDQAESDWSRMHVYDVYHFRCKNVLANEKLAKQFRSIH